MFGDLSHAYVKSENKNIKKLIKYGLKATEKASKFGKVCCCK